MISPDKIEQLSDDGFYQTIEPQVARRQFNMSLGLVGLLTLVALAVGATAGFAPIDQNPAPIRQARIVVQAPQRVHIMQAQGELSTPRG